MKPNRPETHARTQVLLVEDSPGEVAISHRRQANCYLINDFWLTKVELPPNEES